MSCQNFSGQVPGPCAGIASAGLFPILRRQSVIDGRIAIVGLHPGQRLIVNVPDDVTQDATAEIETGAMTPDEEVRRSASVAGLGSDSR